MRMDRAQTFSTVLQSWLCKQERFASTQSRLRGGEGGFRTLGTGVSPYNGLAITRFHMPGVRNQQLTFGKLHHNLGQMTLFGGICATIVQPASSNRAMPIVRFRPST